VIGNIDDMYENVMHIVLLAEGMIDAVRMTNCACWVRKSKGWGKPDCAEPTT
jgi:hypothetical protein